MAKSFSIDLKTGWIFCFILFSFELTLTLIPNWNEFQWLSFFPSSSLCMRCAYNVGTLYMDEYSMWYVELIFKFSIFKIHYDIMKVFCSFSLNTCYTITWASYEYRLYLFLLMCSYISREKLFQCVVYIWRFDRSWVYKVTFVVKINEKLRFQFLFILIFFSEILTHILRLFKKFSFKHPYFVSTMHVANFIVLLVYIQH